MYDAVALERKEILLSKNTVSMDFLTSTPWNTLYAIQQAKPLWNKCYAVPHGKPERFL